VSFVKLLFVTSEHLISLIDVKLLTVNDPIADEIECPKNLANLLEVSALSLIDVGLPTLFSTGLG